MFYGKIHFSRDRSHNELNMHCHLIVSRKDQSNKKKLSPLTNHKNTTKGVIKAVLTGRTYSGRQNRDLIKLFGYKRELTESFEYYNTRRTGNISTNSKCRNGNLKRLTEASQSRKIRFPMKKKEAGTVSPPKRKPKRQQRR